MTTPSPPQNQRTQIHTTSTQPQCGTGPGCVVDAAPTCPAGVGAVAPRVARLGGGGLPLVGRVGLGAAPGPRVAAVHVVALGAALLAAAVPAGGGASVAPPAEHTTPLR